VYNESGGLPNTKVAQALASASGSSVASGASADDPTKDKADSSEVDLDSEEEDLEVEALIDEDLELDLDDDDEINTAKDRSEQLYRAVSSNKFPMVKALLGMQLNRNWQNHRDGFQCALHVVAETNGRVVFFFFVRSLRTCLMLPLAFSWRLFVCFLFFVCVCFLCVLCVCACVGCA
jgi:hypothetical protein